MRWRSLETRARRWIAGGLVALLGIVGAAVSDEFKAAFTSVFDYFKPIVWEYSCRLRAPHKSLDARKPLILFPHLGNDPGDATWKGINALLFEAGDDFDVVPSCLPFEISQADSLDTTRQRFLDAIKPQIASVHADMALFGVAYAPLKAKVWSANFLGGCDWQKARPVDLNASSDQVLRDTRSALVRVIAEGLIAACDRDQNADWSNVAAIIDVVAPYVENKRSLVNDSDYNDIQLHLFGLALSHYAHVGEDPWFDRAFRAINALQVQATSANDSAAFAAYQSALAQLYWQKYQKTNSPDALADFVGFICTLHRNAPMALNDFLDDHSLDAVVGLQAALSAKLTGINTADVEQVLKRSVEKGINPDPKNAEEFNSRCWLRAVTGSDLPLALDDCNQSLRLIPAYANALNSRALVQYKLGAYDAALADYDAAIKLSSDDAGSLFGRGKTKIRMGDSSGGNSDIARSKALQPDIAAVYARYGMN